MHSSRKIGIVTWDYDPPKGGLGRALQQIADTLGKQNHDVRVLSPSGGTDKEGAWTKRIGLHPAFSVLLLAKLQRWIHKTERDLLLFPCGPGGVWLLRKPKHCKTIAIVYHTYLQQARLVPGQWWKRIFIPFERASLSRADHIFCYAEDTRRVLEEEYGCNPASIHFLPQVIDLDPWLEFDGAKEPGLCVCVARLEQRKGIHFLADLWPCIKEQCPHATLLVVGDGVQAGLIDSLVAKESLSVKRISSLDQRDLIETVHRAELVLCPSYVEGFGLVALEAIAAGTIVIANEVDGLRSLGRQGQTGVCVPVGDSAAWVRA